MIAPNGGDPIASLAAFVAAQLGAHGVDLPPGLAAIASGTEAPTFVAMEFGFCPNHQGIVWGAEPRCDEFGGNVGPCTRTALYRIAEVAE